jgi:predicted alpha/beta-fold hydrolase
MACADIEMKDPTLQNSSTMQDQVNSSPYDAPLHLRSAHLQTMLNGRGPRAWRARRILRGLKSRSLLLTAEDGTRLLAEFDQARDSRSRALVVLLHGWEGSSRSAYMLTTASCLLAEGYDVLRVNLRDHGESHHLNRELFNSTRSPEVASALQGYVDRENYQRHYLAGYSLGGSFALRIAADAGAGLRLNACVAVCPPIDPANAMVALNTGFFAYERYFFRLWRDSLRRKLTHFPELDYAEDLARARSIDDLNRMFIPSYTAYKRIEDYFAAYSLVGSRLSALSLPAHMILAQDDPIIPFSDVERIDPIDNLHIEATRHGGHCGFLENLSADSWIESRLLQILAQHR